MMMMMMMMRRGWTHIVYYTSVDLNQLHYNAPAVGERH